MNKRETRKKKREARKAILLFLRKTCRACSAYGTAAAWYDEIKRLKELLGHYIDVLPASHMAKVNASLEVTDTTAKGVAAACKVLKYNLKTMAKSLPMMSSLGAFAVKGLVGVAVLAGVGSALWQANKVKITIVNDNCSDIPVARDLPPDIGYFAKYLGLKLPLWVVANSQETFAVPPVTLQLKSTGPGISLELLNQTARLPLPGNITSLTYDDQELLGNSVTLDLGEQPKHTVVVSCRRQ